MSNSVVWMVVVYAFVVFAELEDVELGGFPPVFEARSVVYCLVYSPGCRAVGATADSPRGYGGDGRAVGCFDMLWFGIPARGMASSRAVQ